MECFIKKIYLGRADEKAHAQFVRFGKGSYGGRAALSLHITDKIKFKGSFEFANDFALFVAENCQANFFGIILSKESLGLENEKKKAGIFQYEGNFSSEDVKKVFDRAYCLLLDASCSGLSLKTKKKLPKPGKSGELKIDDTFCILECDLKYLNKIKEGFLWDIQECKKVKVHHTYEITDLILPKDEKDFEKIRIKTKRKGKLIRKIDIDGNPKEISKDFEA